MSGLIGSSKNKSGIIGRISETLDSTTASGGTALFANSHSTVASGDEVMRIQFSGDGDATGGHFINFYDSVGDIGRINVASTSATQYSTSSDYRLKDVVSTIADALSKVNSLKPIVFKWKRGGDNQEGFLAHEVQEVVPIAVSGEKDAVDDNGDILKQHMDMTYLIPIIVKAIQELSAENTELKTENTELKTKLDALEARVTALEG